jgi:hypothetical protein
MPTPVDSMHFAAWHPIEGDEIWQLGYTICSCGWRSSLARRWSGYGQWRDHASELGKQGEEGARRVEQASDDQLPRRTGDRGQGSFSMPLPQGRSAT